MVIPNSSKKKGNQKKKYSIWSYVYILLCGFKAHQRYFNYELFNLHLIQQFIV